MIPGWIDDIEQDVARCFCDGDTISPSELARRLGISESSAVSLICLLAPEGRVSIERVSLPRRTANQGHEDDPHREHGLVSARDIAGRGADR